MKVTVEFYDSENLYYDDVKDVYDNNHFVKLLDKNEEVIEYFLKEHIKSIKKEEK